jgi:hypothetical protein
MMGFRNEPDGTDPAFCRHHRLLHCVALLFACQLLIGFWLSSRVLAGECNSCGGSGRCRACGGSGAISAGFVHGQPAAYGCVACGGFRGDPVNGPPGRRGSGKCRACRGTGGTGSSRTTPGKRPPPKGPSPLEIARKKTRAEALKLNRTGCVHYKARRWREARDAFMVALAKWPDNATIKRNLDNATRAMENAKFHAASSAATASLNRALVQGGIRELEDVDQAVRNLFAAREAEWGRQFAKRQRERAAFRAKKREALLRMGRDPGQRRSGELPWEAGISNPQIARIMRGVGSIEVPPPLPARKVFFSWKRLATEHGTGLLDSGSDIGFLAWDLFGRIGSKAPLTAKILVIGGKTFIAGEDGACVYLVKQNEIYEGALGYLKDPATRDRFARLVHDLKQGATPPADVNPRMLSAAKAINDPKLGRSGMWLAWGAMLSPEARAAMVRKASMEIGSALIGQGVQGTLGDLTRHERLYGAARLERRKAMALLRETTDPMERAQLKKVVAHIDHGISRMYRVERSGPILGTYAIGKAAGPPLKDQGELRTIPMKTESGSK